jgi:thiol-disulfide isomerase/thioredoxin
MTSRWVARLPRVALAVPVRLAVVGLVLALAVAGCGSAGPAASPWPSVGPAEESPFALCPSAVRATAPAAGAPDSLPDLTLPCFTGGAPVPIARLGRPALINLWASFCEPCREEMPALQAFADELGDRVIVLGVDTSDRWSAAAAAGEGFGARYPSVFDPHGTLAAALGRNYLPVTLVVGADGAVLATDVGGALTLDRLRELARVHFGIDG